MDSKEEIRMYSSQSKALMHLEHGIKQSNSGGSNNTKLTNPLWTSRTKSPSYISNKQVTFMSKRPSVSHIFESENMVDHFLESIVLQNERLILVENLKMVVRHDHELMSDKVKILSGGSSGLEPIHSGFIGSGMLTAAIFGEILMSPPYPDIVEALRLLSKGHTTSILVIITNDMAHRLNFGLACQQVAHEGIRIMCLSVGEDCSGVSVDKTVGRKGLCGILFLQKIAGAMSEEKRTLFEIFSVLNALKGGSLGSVNVNITSNGMTIGNGPKGEAGKFYNHQTISSIVKEGLFYILHPASYFSLHVEKGSNVAVIVNNLGKLSDLYLALIVRETFYQLTVLQVNVVRVYSGKFLTIKNGVGFSISLLKVGNDDKILKWLDSPTSAKGWPNSASSATGSTSSLKNRSIMYYDDPDSLSMDDLEETSIKEKNLGPRFSVTEAKLALSALRSIVKAIIDMEDYLNHLDFDHDYGSTVMKFMISIKKEIDSRKLNIVTPYGLLNSLAEQAAATMGGISGALYTVILSSAAQAFLTSSKFSRITWLMWIEAGRMAREALAAYTRVRPGQHTIMDALHPFVEAFNSPKVATLSQAVEAAMKGAEDTTSMAGSQKSPDPGAYTLAVAMRVAFSELQVDLMLLEQARKEKEEESVWYCDSCERFMQQEKGLEIWYCDSCWMILTRQGEEVWYCDSCLKILEEENTTMNVDEL